VIVGAHVSIAGGVENAVESAQHLGCETFQIFTKNQNQWKEKHYSASEIKKFKSALSSSNQNPNHLAAHDSYLINLCATDPEKLKKSRTAFLNEINRCTHLNLAYLIFHPGSHMEKGEEWGLRLISESLLWAIEASPESNVLLLLETTAGQGTNLGYKIGHLKTVINTVNKPERLGICIDTCHLFAAGYELRGKKGYQNTFQLITQEIGLENIYAFHINDSKKDLGTRVDRHEVIGEGYIGEDLFRNLMNDDRFQNLPGFLEIPGGEESFKNYLVRLKGFRRSGG